MVCSFCETAGHNVRSCKLLKAAIALFIANKGASIAESQFTDAVLSGACIAVDCVTGGVASCIAFMYSAYNTARDTLDLASFTQMSKREQAKQLKTFFGEEAASEPIEDEGWGFW